MISAMDRLYVAAMWVAGIGIAAMSLIIPWGVFARYVLGTGSRWPEPVAILLMIVFTFFGGAVAYRAGSHIAVDMMTSRLPATARRGVARLVDLLVLALSLFLLVWGGKLVLETMGQTIAELPWMPVGVTYLPLPVGGALTALFVIEKLVHGSQHARPVCRFDQHDDPPPVAGRDAPEPVKGL